MMLNKHVQYNNINIINRQFKANIARVSDLLFNYKINLYNKLTKYTVSPLDPKT